MRVFYRRVLDFREIIENRLIQELLSRSENIDREKMVDLSNGIKKVVESSFSDLITSLQALENAESAKLRNAVNVNSITQVADIAKTKSRSRKSKAKT